MLYALAANKEVIDTGDIARHYYTGGGGHSTNIADAWLATEFEADVERRSLSDDWELVAVRVAAYMEA